MAKLSNVRFPKEISIGAAGGPGFSTDMVIHGSGKEKRNQNWEHARCAYDVQKACRTLEHVEILITFFRVAKGMANSFRFKDYTDFRATITQGIFVQLTATTFQMWKLYTNADGTDSHKIVFPVQGSIAVRQGVTVLTETGDYTIDYSTGILTVLGSPTPAPTAWSGAFDRHCRFDVDQLQLAAESPTFFRSTSIPIVEVKD